MNIARIAYVDHSYHKKTRSTNFLPSVLTGYGHEVDYFWDESWAGGRAVEWEAVADYDVVIMFQSYCPIGRRYFRNLHPNVIFIPMLDQFGIWRGPMLNLTDFWEPFQGSKVLNFSTALHAMTTGMGIKSHFVRYYPDEMSPVATSSRLRGFYWLRREKEIPWKIIRALIANAEFESFHIHLAADPQSGVPVLPESDDIKRFNVTTSTWFENKSDLDALLEKANVYFAPRMEEGIGQSFLEALSRGQCVVAPNEGTMNEYIVSGLNGLLYDRENPMPLDFSLATDIGMRAREAAKSGRKKWEASQEDLVKFILAPSADFYIGKYAHPLSGEFANCGVKRVLRQIYRNNAFIRKIRASFQRWR